MYVIIYELTTLKIEIGSKNGVKNAPKLAQVRDSEPDQNKKKFCSDKVHCNIGSFTKSVYFYRLLPMHLYRQCVKKCDEMLYVYKSCNIRRTT